MYLYNTIQYNIISTMTHYRVVLVQSQAVWLMKFISIYPERKRNKILKIICAMGWRLKIRHFLADAAVLDPKRQSVAGRCSKFVGLKPHVSPTDMFMQMLHVPDHCCFRQRIQWWRFNDALYINVKYSSLLSGISNWKLLEELFHYIRL